jgi:site-specific DNA-adenine methylase
MLRPLAIIKALDAEDTFFHLDPPYVGAEQGCYDRVYAGRF